MKIILLTTKHPKLGSSKALHAFYKIVTYTAIKVFNVGSQDGRG